MRKIFGKKFAQQSRAFLRDFDTFAVPALVEAVGSFYGVPGAGAVYSGIREGPARRKALVRQKKDEVKRLASEKLRSKIDGETAERVDRRKNEVLGKADFLRDRLLSKNDKLRSEASKDLVSLRGLGLSAQDLTDALGGRQ